MAPDSQLAIRGGPRSVTVRSALQRVRLRRGLERTWDLRGLIGLTLRGRTSQRHNGGLVARFEEDFARMHDAAFGLAMNSGTAALHSAYAAVGVGPGSEVIVPSYTWQATATPVLQCGGVPVFCDVDPQTFTLDPDAVERAITPRTRAVCVVHIWGNPADLERLRAIARRHDVALIEDCSHAHGARYQGRGVGSWGDVGCFSLQGAKAVDAGEGGIALTSDPVLYDRMLLLGHSGMVPDRQKAGTFDAGGLEMSLGLKFRPHLFAVHLAARSFARLPARNRRAARVWQVLCEELDGAPGLQPQRTLPGAERGGFYSFVFRYDGEELGGPDARTLVAAVEAEGAPLTRDQYHAGQLHQYPVFTTLDRRVLGGGCFDPTRPWEENLWRGALPVTERLGRTNLRFPPQLADTSERFVRQCARALRKVLAAEVPAGASSPVAAGAEPRLAAEAR